MTYEYFRVTGADEAFLDYTDLFSITLRKILIPDGTKLFYQQVKYQSILESLHKMRIRESDQLQTVLAMYEQEIHLDRSMPNYRKLKTMHACMARRHMYHKIETGVLVKTFLKRRMSALKEIRSMLPVESKRAVFRRRCLQLPPRRQLAWKENTVVLSCSEIADTK